TPTGALLRGRAPRVTVRGGIRGPGPADRGSRERRSALGRSLDARRARPRRDPGAARRECCTQGASGATGLGSLRATTVFAAILAAIVGVFAATLPANDPDLFWHLASGAWMIDHRQLLDRDVFS